MLWEADPDKRRTQPVGDEVFRSSEPLARAANAVNGHLKGQVDVAQGFSEEKPVLSVNFWSSRAISWFLFVQFRGLSNKAATPTYRGSTPKKRSTPWSA